MYQQNKLRSPLMLALIAVIVIFLFLTNTIGLREKFYKVFNKIPIKTISTKEKICSYPFTPTTTIGTIAFSVISGKNCFFAVQEQQENGFYYALFNDQKVAYNGFIRYPYERFSRFSAVTNRIAYKVSECKNPACTVVKEFMVIDGKKMKDYDSVSEFTFSPDEKHFIYKAYDNAQGKTKLIYDNQVRDLDYEYTSSLKFSPDSNHFAYFAKNFAYFAKKSYQNYIVVDNKNLIDAATIEYFDFAVDNSLIYKIKENGKFAVIYNGQKSKLYDYIDDSIITTSDYGLTYVARQENKEVVVFANQEGKSFDIITNLTVSPNGQRFGYVGWDGCKPIGQAGIVTCEALTIVLDNKTILNDQTSFFSSPENRLDSHIVFSSDSTKVAYILPKTEKVEGGETSRFAVVVDGKESASYSYIKKPVFSPNSKHFAYIAFQPAGSGESIVVDNKAGEEYDEIYNLSFSPDSKFVIYNARRGSDIYYIIEPVAK